VCARARVCVGIASAAGWSLFVVLDGHAGEVVAKRSAQTLSKVITNQVVRAVPCRASAVCRAMLAGAGAGAGWAARAARAGETAAARLLRSVPVPVPLRGVAFQWCEGVGRGPVLVAAHSSPLARAASAVLPLRSTLSGTR